jgi:tRNA pseudouridine38-40 synthase
MRNLKLTIAYDGTDFHGWQVQPNLPTIQGTLQDALQKLFNHKVDVTGSGRTDAGVHAYAQVANVRTIRTMEPGAVVRGANALLPPDIRVLEAEDVDESFHARHSARKKTYDYRLWREPIVSPFESRYVYPFRYPLDYEAMAEASMCFLGTHDFTSFCATATEVEDRVRTIYEAKWQRREHEWVFRICGDGFLQYMVRTIVGTLLYVGSGKLRCGQIPEILAARDRRLAGPCVPARGLHLDSVDY